MVHRAVCVLVGLCSCTDMVTGETWSSLLTSYADRPSLLAMVTVFIHRLILRIVS